jgi:hypothetical protein
MSHPTSVRALVAGLITVFAAVPATGSAALAQFPDHFTDSFSGDSRAQRRLFMIRLSRTLLPVLAVAAFLVPVAQAGAAQPGAVPKPVEPGPFTVEGLCDFPVILEFSGKAGEIDLPGGVVIFTAPGQDGDDYECGRSEQVGDAEHHRYV